MPALRRLLLPLVLAAILLPACQAVPALAVTPLAEPRPTNTPFTFLSLFGQQQVATYTPTLPPTASPTPPPVFSGETITLHLLCALTGPLPEVAAARAAAFEQAVAAQNAAGGLHSAELLVQVVDSATEAPVLDELSASAVPLAVLCDAASEAALGETLRQRRIPTIGLGAFDLPGGRLQALEPIPSAALAYWLQDLKANWRQRQPLSAGNQLRLAVLSWPAELTGNALTPQLQTQAQALGVELVYQIQLAPQLDLNVYDALYAMRDEHANIVYINADSYGLAYVLNALTNLGLRNRVVIAAPATAYEPLLYDYLAEPDFAEGLYLISAEGFTSQTWELGHMQAALQVALEALDAAIAQSGSLDEVTSASLAQALAGMPPPTSLSVWQVGSTPGDVRQVAQETP